MNLPDKPFAIILLMLLLASITAVLAALAGVPAWAMMGAFAGLAVLALRRLVPGRAAKAEPLLLAGLLFISILLCWKGQQIVARFGQWDAWAMWNYKALTLARPGGVRWLLYAVHPFDHSDYPPGLPGLLSFFARVLGGQWMPHIALGVHAAIMVLSPCWVVTVLYQRSRVAALGAALIFCCTACFFVQPMAQNADALLGTLLTGALILLEPREVPDRRALFVGGFFLGGLAWVKNEGIVLAALVLAVYSLHLLKKGRWKSVATGAALPLLLAVAWKWISPASNDLLMESLSHKLLRAQDSARYRVVWAALWALLKGEYPGLGVSLLLAILLPIARRAKPGLNALVLWAGMAAYFFIYVVTPQDLGWHLGTSQDRLLFQLYPAAVLCAGLEVATTADFWRRRSKLQQASG